MIKFYPHADQKPWDTTNEGLHSLRAQAVEARDRQSTNIEGNRTE